MTVILYVQNPRRLSEKKKLNERNEEEEGEQAEQIYARRTDDNVERHPMCVGTVSARAFFFIII